MRTCKLLASAILMLFFRVAGNGVSVYAATVAPYHVKAWLQSISLREIPTVTTALGLKLHDPAAERAFFAKDYDKVSTADFRALQARAEQAKRDEEKLVADHSSPHAIVCNKLIKVGTEAIVGVINHDPPFAMEHLQKFRINVPLAGKTCKDVGLES